jgi:hypothetical protein
LDSSEHQKVVIFFFHSQKRYIQTNNEIHHQYYLIYNTKKMEKIQERALKFIYNENHHTYEELLAKSKLPSP